MFVSDEAYIRHLILKCQSPITTPLIKTTKKMMITFSQIINNMVSTQAMEGTVRVMGTDMGIVSLGQWSFMGNGLHSTKRFLSI